MKFLIQLPKKPGATLLPLLHKGFTGQHIKPLGIWVRTDPDHPEHYAVIINADEGDELDMTISLVSLVGALNKHSNPDRPAAFHPWETELEVIGMKDSIHDHHEQLAALMTVFPDKFLGFIAELEVEPNRGGQGEFLDQLKESGALDVLRAKMKGEPL